MEPDGKFNARLNKILDRVTSDEFLHSRGLGNEIPFYAFDYPPENELTVRRHIDFLCKQIPKKRPGMRQVHINLFDLIIAYLKKRGVYDKTLEMQRNRGDAATFNALKAPLDPKRVAAEFVENAKPAEQDLVLVSGIGSAYPLLRTHNLLNNLHAQMGNTPLVLFYPGKYDGQNLRLFGQLKDTPYYRAFRLVD